MTQPASEAPRTCTNAKRILVVEDWFAVAEMVEMMLEDLGYEVIGPAKEVDEALRLIEADPPELALLDVQLEDDDTVPIAQALHARGIPFVFMTGYADPKFPEPFSNATWLKKPFDDRTLERALDQLRSACSTSGK